MVFNLRCSATEKASKQTKLYALEDIKQNEAFCTSSNLARGLIFAPTIVGICDNIKFKKKEEQRTE